MRRDFKQESGPFEVVDFIVVRRLSGLKKSLARLKAIRDLEAVIVCSGDGTIIAVINALKDKDVTFGFLPMGTVNAFVRSLGLPDNYEEAFEAIKSTKTRKVALGEVNGTLFANIAAIGISSVVAGKISDRTKQILGPLAYGVTSIRELLFHKALKCTVQIDGKEIKLETHQLVIANGKYHGYQEIGSEASVHKNKLLLVAFGDEAGKRHYLSSTIRFFLHRHEEHAHTELIPFKTATITTSPRRKIEADGEVVGYTPAKFSVKPDAIRVLVG